MNCNANANFSVPNKPSLQVHLKMYVSKVYRPLGFFNLDKTKSNDRKLSDLNGLGVSKVLLKIIPLFGITILGIPLILGANGSKKDLKSCKVMEWILRCRESSQMDCFKHVL